MDSDFIPLARWRNRFAMQPAAALGVVLVLTAVAVGSRLLIAPWIGTAGLVLFLPFIIATAYLTGPRWAYATLALNLILVWLLVFPDRFGFVPARVASTVDLILLALASVGSIEFVRLLDRTLGSLERERRRSLDLAEERKDLMVELAHRTSNNFQMVSAMLTLSRRTVSDPAARKALSEAAERVTAMGVVQRRLSSNTGEGIDLVEFLPVLCTELEGALGVKVVFQPNHLAKVSARAASTVALIIQEFVANAAEHGRHESGQPMTVHVHLHRHGDNRALLLVEDDGSGVPEGFDPHEGTSLGLTLVDSFAASLDGSFDIRNRSDGPGAVASVEFVLEQATDASRGS